jgi:hypothetical protein
LFGTAPSIGHISGVINEASRRAHIFDAGISLSGIHEGAHDELFQGGSPIITGIDAHSSYTYLLEETEDRTADTWEAQLLEVKARGLDLGLSLNDGASALKSGVLRVYPDAVIQRDVFHASYEMGREVSKAVRKAYAYIKEEEELRMRVQGKRPQQKTKEKLDEITIKTAEAVQVSDVIEILYSWLKEMLGFSGYGKVEATGLIEFILYEMEKVATNFPKLQKECGKVRNALPSLLSFIDRLGETMHESAHKLNVPSEAFDIMYRQMSFSPESQQHQDMEYQLVRILMHSYDSVRSAFGSCLSRTKKASSLVENLNGRIRTYINIKRTVPSGFFILMKVFFNTKKYRRSRCKERVGKSPWELLTGESQPEFLEALGF